MSHLVLDGNWTYEDFFSLVAMGNADLDGNSVYDENDQYGLFVQSSLGMNLYYASGLSYINKSDEGLLVPEFTGEKAVEIMQDIIGKAGFGTVTFRRLTMGICTLYMATK